MTPVELKLTLDEEAGALVVVGQWALLENSWGSRASLPSANFDILPSGNTTRSLAATVRTAGMTWKKDPSRWPWYRIPLSPSTAPDTGGSRIVGRSRAELAMTALFRCWNT